MSSMAAAMGRFVPVPCAFCRKDIADLGQAFRVPVLDPFESTFADEVAEVIGRTAHVACWKRYARRNELIELGMRHAASDYRQGRKIAGRGNVGAWVRNLGEEGLAQGLMFLPNASLFFENMRGLDLKGGFVEGTAEQIIFLTRVLSLNAGPGLFKSSEWGLGIRKNWKIEITESGHDGRLLVEMGPASEASNALLLLTVAKDDCALLAMPAQ